MSATYHCDICGESHLVQSECMATDVQRLTAERDRLREEVQSIFHALTTECPAYPGQANTCDLDVCDCFANTNLAGQIKEIVATAERRGAEKALRWAYHNDAWRKVLMGGVSVGSNDTEDSYAQRGLSALFPPPAPDAGGGV